MCSTAQAPREGRLLAYPESGLLSAEQACDTALGRCTSRLLIGSASWPVAAAVAYKVLWIAVSATSAPQRRQHPSWRRRRWSRRRCQLLSPSPGLTSSVGGGSRTARP